VDPWFAAHIFADAHEQIRAVGAMVLSWSAGRVVSLLSLHVMDRLERLSRIHDVLAGMDEQLSLAVSAESVGSLSAGGRLPPLSFLDDGRGLAGTGSW